MRPLKYIKQTKIIIFSFVLKVILSNTVYCEDGLLNSKPDGSDNIQSEIVKKVTDISQNVDNADGEAIMKMLSSQYLQSGKKLQELFKANNQSTESLQKGIINDFNFYKVKSINKVVVNKNVAFVVAIIDYLPSYLKKHQNKVSATNEVIWSNFGGNIISNTFNRNGSGFVVYYFVKQNGVFKLHLSYFSSDPFNEEKMNLAKTELEKLADQSL